MRGLDTYLSRVTGVSGQKAPAGTFGIAPDYENISKTTLDAMSGRKQ
ncbi:hypothetical protein [Mucilaginibacter sp.]|nr:hypothetical protein [Mucilaginibacter sp.]MDB4921282.1 hypothetical protein [Mucilaginibacter sp.]